MGPSVEIKIKIIFNVWKKISSMFSFCSVANFENSLVYLNSRNQQKYIAV